MSAQPDGDTAITQLRSVVDQLEPLAPDVVQMFPLSNLRASGNPGSVIRLIGALLVETNDEMIAVERRYIAATSVAAVLDHDTPANVPARSTRLTASDPTEKEHLVNGVIAVMMLLSRLAPTRGPISRQPLPSHRATTATGATRR